MRVESSRRTRDGGWIHRLGPEVVLPPLPRSRPRASPTAPIDWPKMMAEYRAGTEALRLGQFAKSLHVTARSLRRLGVAQAADRGAWAFPMHDAGGEIIGIRLRGKRGDKWAVKGSRNGVFLPDGGIGDLCDEVLVCEGPTDVAAMLDLEFYAIGRAACTGQEDMVAELVRRRDVVILSDRDEAKKRPGGTEFYPGQEGAQRLAEALFRPARTVRVIKPLKGKDARAWRQAGVTRDVVATVIRNALYWRPANA